MAKAPATPMATNHTTMTGPKSLPTRSVPRDWMRNSAARIATEIGTMNRCAAWVETPIPSTAEMTEIAGVIMPSPKSIAAPAMTMSVDHCTLIGRPNVLAGDMRASSAKIPPSPS
jgi:hypothetical protein